MSTAVLEAPASIISVLRQSPQPLLRRVHVEEDADDVVLTGSLPSYFLKQLAQETVMPLLNGRRLMNLIMVR